MRVYHFATPADFLPKLIITWETGVAVGSILRTMVRKILMIGILVLIIMAILWLPRFKKSSSTSGINVSAKPAIPYVQIGSVTYEVEIANTNELRAHGLSDRSSLPSDKGMLFLFDQKGQYQFWMKDMHFPIDMIWIDGKTIVDISQSVPPPQPNEINPAIRQPRAADDKVLEVNAGEAKKQGFALGQQVNSVLR